MERPFFSLSKTKRMKPIEYRNENDGIFVTVQPHQDYGMATIWDADILIWAASVLCDMKNRGTNDFADRKFHSRSGRHPLAGWPVCIPSGESGTTPSTSGSEACWHRPMT